MISDLPPLDAETRALLEAERMRPDPPGELREAVKTKLIAATVGLAVGVPAAAKASSLGAGSLLSHPATIALASATIGTALVVGIALKSPDRPPPPAGVAPPAATRDYVHAAAAPAPQPSPAQTPPIPFEIPAHRGRPAVRTRAAAPHPAEATSAAPSVSPTAPSASPATVDAALSVERTLIERARVALASGDAEAALRITAMHERRFPEGRLVEQRERLAVESLWKAGREEEARQRLGAFEKAHPQSLLLPDLRAALRARP
jgi:hypothetical protein